MKRVIKTKCLHRMLCTIMILLGGGIIHIC